MQASEGHALDPDSKAKDHYERKTVTTERKLSTTERKISPPERKTCASVTLPSAHERPLQQRHLRYQEECQDTDERLEPNYDHLQQQRIDFCTYQRREEQNDINFREESYNEYVNNFPEEQFQLEETGSYESRFTIEKLPGQLQVIGNRTAGALK